MVVQNRPESFKLAGGQDPQAGFDQFNGIFLCSASPTGSICAARRNNSAAAVDRRRWLRSAGMQPAEHVSVLPATSGGSHVSRQEFNANGPLARIRTGRLLVLERANGHVLQTGSRASYVLPRKTVGTTIVCVAAVTSSGGTTLVKTHATSKVKPAQS
jgi:hypothetical protein